MELTRASFNRAIARGPGLLLIAALAVGCGDDGTAPLPQPPTIDGIRSPGEWDGATEFQPTTEIAPGIGPSTILITTDGTNLYVALEVTDQAAPTDQFEVRFDNDNDNLLTVGDDAFGLSGSGAITDGQYSGGSYTLDDVSQDGEGAVGQDGATAFYEFSHPLNTGDPDDLAAEVGDIVGMCFRYFNDGAGSSGVPGSCALTVTQQGTYLDVTIKLP
jgi:hypothetical protein